MVTRALALALCGATLAGCVEENFTCRKDSDCNLGDDGRCELDQRCTVRSTTCETGREYGPLQGVLSGTCFDVRRDPANPCAEGQPPARGDSACMAEICDVMPACCRSSWSGACVQQAQLRCDDLVCDTRIAITAQRSTSTELWTATYHPDTQWDMPVRYEPASTLSWFAPARGELEPRLGVFTHGIPDPPTPATLDLAGATYQLEPRSYFQAQSIDFERNGHDVLLLGSATGGPTYETLDLDTMERRAFAKQYTTRTVVGEVNRDGYPDIASCNNGGGYAAILNEEEGTERTFGVSAGDTINGQPTPGMAVEARSIEFSDVDGNGALDLLVAGRQIRAHMPPTDAEPLNASSQFVSIDCMPPQSPAGNCTGPEGAVVSWVATALPAKDRTRVVAVPFGVNGQLPERRIYLLDVSPGGIAPAPPTVEIGSCVGQCDKRWVAVASRDLDGDHVMDLIVVDENLNIYTSRSTIDGKLVPTLQIDQPRESITNVRLVVTGAPVTP